MDGILKTTDEAFVEWFDTLDDDLKFLWLKFLVVSLAQAIFKGICQISIEEKEKKK